MQDRLCRLKRKYLRNARCNLTNMYQWNIVQLEQAQGQQSVQVSLLCQEI